MTSQSNSNQSVISTELRDLCTLLRLKASEWTLLVSVCNTQELVVIHELLRTKTFRSASRRQAAEDIRIWLSSSPRRYMKPLSRYKFDKYKPTWPVHVRFPALPPLHVILQAESDALQDQLVQQAQKPIEVTATPTQLEFTLP